MCCKMGLTAILTPRSSGSVPVNLPKSSLKKSVRPQSNVLCLVEFWRCDSLRVCSKRTCSRCGSLFSTTGTGLWNFEAEIPALVSRNRVLLQQDYSRPHTARTTMTKIQELKVIELLPHPAYIPDLALSDYHIFRSMVYFSRGSHRILRITNHRLVPSRDDKPRCRMA